MFISGKAGQIAKVLLEDVIAGKNLYQLATGLPDKVAVLVVERIRGAPLPLLFTVITEGCRY